MLLVFVVVAVVDKAELTSTVVIGIEHGKEGADGKDIVVLGKLGHCDGRSLQAAGKLQ